MKTKLPACFILISAVLSPGCTSIAPSATVSERVIESIVPTKRPETPWRLTAPGKGAVWVAPRCVVRQLSMWSGKSITNCRMPNQLQLQVQLCLGPSRFPELRLNPVAIATAC